MQNGCRAYTAITTVDPPDHFQNRGSMCQSAVLVLPQHFNSFVFLKRGKIVCVQTELFVYSTFEAHSILLYSCFKAY